MRSNTEKTLALVSVRGVDRKLKREPPIMTDLLTDRAFVLLCPIF